MVLESLFSVPLSPKLNNIIILYLLLVLTYRILDPSDFVYSLGRVNVRGAEVSAPPPRKL